MSIIKGTIKEKSGNELWPITSTDLVKPIQTLEFNSFNASADANPGGWYYYLRMVPIDNYKQWHFKARVKMYSPYNASYPNRKYMSYDGICEVWGAGYTATYTAYRNFNSHNNTSYRSFYHHVLRRCANEADTGTYGYLMGFRFQSSYAVTNTNYPRNITVEILAADNLTPTYFNALTLAANVENAAKYTTYSELNGSDNGLQETGDANTTTFLQLNSDYGTVGSIPLGGLGLYGYSADNKFEALSAYTSTYSSYTASLSTTRVYSTAGWDLAKGLRYGYFWAGYLPGASPTVSGAVLYASFDFRYADNMIAGYTAGCNFTFEPDKFVYIRGTLNQNTNVFVPAPYDPQPIVIKGYYYNSKFYHKASGVSGATYVALGTNYVYYDITSGKYYKCTNASSPGTFALLGDGSTLDAWTGNKYKKAYTQTLPTEEDGYYYLQLGKAYYNSSYYLGAYQLNLMDTHPVFYYKNGQLCEYTGIGVVNTVDDQIIAGNKTFNNDLVTDSILVVREDQTSEYATDRPTDQTGLGAGDDLDAYYYTTGITVMNCDEETKRQYSYPAKSGTFAMTSDIPTIPSAGATATAVSTTASGGSATTWSKSDHIHSISLATGDNNGQVKIAGTNVSVKGLGTAAYKNESNFATPADVNNCIKNGDLLVPLYGPKIYYNATYDDSFWDFGKRYYCIMTVHPITVDGVTYPHTNSSKTIADDDYFVDSTVEATYNSIDNPDVFHLLFDGSPDTTAITVSGDKYVKIRLLPVTVKTDNYSPATSTTTFDGYPYGWIIATAYYGSNVGGIKYATYNKHSSWPTGWYETTGVARGDSAGMTWTINDGGHYSRTEMDIWFIGGGDSTKQLRPSELYWLKNRVTNINRENSYVSKYCDETITSDWTWGTFGTTNLKIYANGNIDTHRIMPIANNTYNCGAASNKWQYVYTSYLGDSTTYLTAAYINTIYENGTTLANKYAAKSHTHQLNANPVYSLVNQDTRSTNPTPSSFFTNDSTKRSLTADFKSIGAIDTPFTTGSYCNLFTSNQWTDASGGYASQIAVGEAGIAVRHGTSGTTWSTWEQVITGDLATINDLTNIFNGTRS